MAKEVDFIALVEPGGAVNLWFNSSPSVSCLLFRFVYCLCQCAFVQRAYKSFLQSVRKMILEQLAVGGSHLSSLILMFFSIIF